MSRIPESYALLLNVIWRVNCDRKLKFCRIGDRWIFLHIFAFDHFKIKGGRSFSFIVADRSRLKFFDDGVARQVRQIWVCSMLYFILSSIISAISLGFSKYLRQQDISLTTCFLALTCTIVGSIELYLSIQKRMEIAQAACKEFHILSIDIFKTLTLSPWTSTHAGKGLSGAQIRIILQADR